MWQQLPATFMRHSLQRSEPYLAAIAPLGVLMACQNADAERAAAAKSLAAAMSADVLAPLIAEGGLWSRATPLHLALAHSTGNFMLTMLHNDLYSQTKSVISGESPLLSALNSSVRRERYKGSSVSALATHTLAAQPLKPFMDALNAVMHGRVPPLRAAAALWQQLLLLRDVALKPQNRLVRKKAPRLDTQTASVHSGSASSARRAPRERMVVQDDSDDEGHGADEGGEGGFELDPSNFLQPGDTAIGLKIAGLACIQAACAQDDALNTTDGYAGLFQQPVVEQFPHLREKYSGVVLRPIDLGTMRTKLFSNEYDNLSQLHDDAAQMLANAQLFNKGDRHTLHSAEMVYQAFLTVAAVAAPRLQMHLRGVFFERQPQEEPEHLQSAAIVHRGGLLEGGAGGLGLGPLAAAREPDVETEAHFRASYTASGDKLSLQELLQLCHSAAWDADDEEFVVSLPDGPDFTFQVSMQGCFRRPLQSTFPALALDILKRVSHPVDMATMLHRIHDARYASLSEARAELVAMGEQATLVLGEGHAMLPAFRQAWQAAASAWDAEAAFLAPRLSPPPSPEEVQGAIARRDEARRASQKATATMKAPLVQPPAAPAAALRASVKRTADGAPVGQTLDPSALASEVVRSMETAQAAAAAKEDDAAAAAQPAGQPYPEEVAAVRARREFAVFQAACSALRDPRLVRVLSDALFDIAKTHVKTGTPLRESKDAALLLALLPSGAAQYAPLFSGQAATVPLLGTAAATQDACTAVVSAQTWAGATFATAGIMQVHLNRAAIAEGPSSEPAGDDKDTVQMPPAQRIALEVSADSLACPTEGGLRAVLLGAASDPVGWQLALRLVLPRLKTNARLAICLLRTLGWVTTAPGSTLGSPERLCTLAASVSRTLVELCPKLQAQVAASRKIMVGKVHSRLYADAMTQHIMFVIQQWLPALLLWAGRTASVAPSPLSLAKQQSRMHQGVPNDANAAHTHHTAASTSVWRTVVLPLLLQSWFDVAEAAAAVKMSNEVQQGMFLHLFLQIAGQAAFFHAKDCELPAPAFAPGAVLPEGGACCVGTLQQARAFRGVQFKLKAWLKRLDLSSLLTVYEHSAAAVADGAGHASDVSVGNATGSISDAASGAGLSSSPQATVPRARAASESRGFDAVFVSPLVPESASSSDDEAEPEAGLPTTVSYTGEASGGPDEPSAGDRSAPPAGQVPLISTAGKAQDSPGAAEQGSDDSDGEVREDCK